MDAYRSTEQRYTKGRNVDYRTKLKETINTMQQANSPTCECGSADGLARRVLGAVLWMQPIPALL